ncbi:MAG TPA: RNA methyltransferase [Pyrinomonadaceae bacterium]|nr:RNA methyltransferase [Pyrinomonadaceae bacterium]
MRATVQISSRDNPHLKEARRVRDGKEREKIFIEGARLVKEAVRAGLEIEMLFLSKDGVFRAGELLETETSAGIFQVTDSALSSISDTVTSQGVLAIASRPAPGQGKVEQGLANAAVPVVAFLHQTNNPSNLGAVIRTADAAGAAGVIVSSGSADAFSPKALRAAMGSSFRLPVWADADLSDVLRWAEGKDLQTVATEIGATRSYADIDWTRPTLLLLGSEAHGLPKGEMEEVDEKIMIPMETSVESLNLAVACGVILFEARRQNSLG